MQLERVLSVKQQPSAPLGTRTELERAVEVARELRQRERFNKLDYYDPYPYQQRFHETGHEANQRLLMAANRIGKSYCGAAELAYHVTPPHAERFNELMVHRRLYPRMVPQSAPR